MARDITREQQLQASLRRSETMAAMGSLVAGVAHEVRNPLFGISSVLDAFEARLGEQADYQRFRSVLRGELDRLNHFMQELLEYGTPPSQQLYEGSIADIITQAVLWSAPLAERLKVKITHEVQQTIAPILMDRRRLPQAFINLLENAIHYSPSGGIVSVEAKQIWNDDRDWIECTIKDCGPGFRPDDFSRIFEPFFSRRRGGTGLGLSIALRIVEGHGGRIMAGNRPEGGAVMTLSFPSAKDQTRLAEGSFDGS
jgi:signal transduction histidine kinase